MSNSPLRGLTRSRSRSRGALVRPGWCVVSLYLRRLRRICAAVADASAGEPAVTLATASRPAPKWGGRRSAGRRTTCCRARRARRHACEAWGVPRKYRDPASRRSTAALSAQEPFRTRHYLRDPASRLLTASHCHGGLRHRAFRSRLYGRYRRHSPLRLLDRLRRRPSWARMAIYISSSLR